MSACDFFTVDLIDGTHAYVLAVIEHATRRVRLLGVTFHPSAVFASRSRDYDRCISIVLGPDSGGARSWPRAELLLTLGAIFLLHRERLWSSDILGVGARDYDPAHADNHRACVLGEKPCNQARI